MYANRNEAEITLGRSADFEGLVDEWSTIQSQNPGFMGASLLQSYANPGRYTLFSRWTDRDASVAAARREQFKAFAQKFLTSGLARPTRLTEAYESVFEVDQPNPEATASTAERWADLTLRAPAVAPEFEKSFRQLAELIRQHAPGVVSVRLRRSMGSDTKYLSLTIATDRAAARGWLLVPEIRAFMQKQSLIELLSGEPSAEIHHVVKRYVGPAAPAAEAAAAARAQAR